MNAGGEYLTQACNSQSAADIARANAYSGALSDFTRGLPGLASLYKKKV